MDQPLFEIFDVSDEFLCDGAFTLGGVADLLEQAALAVNAVAVDDEATDACAGGVL